MFQITVVMINPRFIYWDYLRWITYSVPLPLNLDIWPFKEPFYGLLRSHRPDMSSSWRWFTHDRFMRSGGDPKIGYIKFLLAETSDRLIGNKMLIRSSSSSQYYSLYNLQKCLRPAQMDIRVYFRFFYSPSTTPPPPPSSLPPCPCVMKWRGAAQ